MQNMNRVVELIKRLGDGNQEVRVSATDALVNIGKPAVSMLVEALKTQNKEIRYEAIGIFQHGQIWG